MVEAEILTVAKFAALAGVSKQNIYKQVHNPNSRLYPFTIRRGKTHFIKAVALKELYNVETTNTTQEGEKGVNETTFTTPQDEEKTTNTTTQGEELNQGYQQNQPQQSLSTKESQLLSTDYIAYLKDEIAELKKGKEEAEQRLNAVIQEKDNIIKEQSAQLAELAKQVAEIANKALITTSQQQFLSAADKVEKQETIIEAEEEKKKGFFKRLFK